ncbi:hypothetical protein BDR04DRAFT_1127707 [Suillus decipiens]|nr:hypothetical protein BDR04DRAFT_1127707 [Suillus decipiens]
MPGPGSNKAPSFNGETSELLEFFEIFEDLVLSCSLTDEQKCKIIVRYTDPLTKRFWVTLTSYKSLQYTIQDLEHVVLNSANSEITTETELHQYYQQFCPIAVWLETNSKISA